MENLTSFQQFLVGCAAVVVMYAAWSLLALTWRSSNRILAQAELYEAQAGYYTARAQFIEVKTEHLTNRLANNSANTAHDDNKINSLQSPAIIAQKD
jgi:hypothetical protein